MSSVKRRPISSIARRPPTNGVTYWPGHSTSSDDASDISVKRTGAPTLLPPPSVEPAARSRLQPQSRRRKLRSDKSTASMPVGGNKLAPLGAAKTDWYVAPAPSDQRDVRSTRLPPLTGSSENGASRRRV